MGELRSRQSAWYLLHYQHRICICHTGPEVRGGGLYWPQMPAEVVPRSGAISRRLTATKLPGQGAELSLSCSLRSPNVHKVSKNNRIKN